MGYLLRSARGRKEGLAIPIRQRTFLIGSSAKSQIRSRKPGIANQHCALVVRKRKLYLQDLRSGLPTLVNGLEVTPGARLVLKKGDKVALGPMEFIVEQRRKKPTALVSAPYAAPPIPLGRPANASPAAPPPIPVTEALAFSTPAAPRPSQPDSRVWTLAAVGFLAVVGLGLGLLISRALVAGGNGEEQVADSGNPEKREDGRLAKRGASAPDRAKGNGTGERKSPAPDLKDSKSDKLPKPPPELKPNEQKQTAGAEAPDRKDKPNPAAPKPADAKPANPKPADLKPADPPKENPEKPRIAYAQHIQPIFEARCINCHGTKLKKGGLDLSTVEAMLRGGDSGPAIVAGNLEKSPVWITVEDGSMPKAGKPLTAAEKKAIQDWIAGATKGTLAR